jgi:hypothetical protein
MSNLEIVISWAITLLQGLFLYLLLPILATALAILLIVASVATILVVKSRYKEPDWFDRKA